MRFGLFGSAAARRGGPEFDSAEGFRDFIDYNVEAEALGFHSTFVVEHHFTGFGQVSATINLLTWLGARTRRLRLGTAVMVLPWHNPVLLAEQAATLDLLSGGRLDFGIGKGYRYNEFAGFMCRWRRPTRGSRSRSRSSSRRGPPTSRSRIAASTGSSTISSSSRRPRRSRTRRSGWAPAASARSARSPSTASICCSASTPRRTMSRSNIAVYKAAVEAKGRRFDPMQVGVTRAFFVADSAPEREAAMERRLQNRVRQLKLATPPTARSMAGRTAPPATRKRSTRTARCTAHPTRSPGSSTRLREAGVGYVLINGGGSGGGERGRAEPAPLCARGHAAVRRSGFGAGG